MLAFHQLPSICCSLIALTPSNLHLASSVDTATLLIHFCSPTSLAFKMTSVTSAFVGCGAVHQFGFFPKNLRATATNSSKRCRAKTIHLCAESPGPKPPIPDFTTPVSTSSPSSSNGVGRPSSEVQTSEHLQTATKLSTNSEHFDPLGKEDLAKSQGTDIAISLGPFSTSIPARWLLYSVPFFWGSFAPAVRYLFAQDQHPDPSIFNTERLLLSTLIYVPVLLAEFSSYRNRNSPEVEPNKSFAFVLAGTELGVYVFLANVCQVLGLQHTSASRAAFLVQLQTVFVPVLSGLLGLDKISRSTWISSLVAVAGVALLSSDKGHGTVSSFNGDALEVLSALFFSTYIIRLSKFCNDIPANPLVATKIAVQTVLSFAWVALAELFIFFKHTPTEIAVTDTPIPWTFAAVLANVLVVMWTGVMSSAVSGWAQTKGQQGVPPSEAVVIFATQPLWASALAALVLGESFGLKGFAGGALIIVATLLSSKSGDSFAEGEKKEA